MKSILLASKPSNTNQLTVGSKLGRNESSIPINQHYHHHHLLNTATTTTKTTATESVTESFEKEHFNKLFSNSKKQVIRTRCSVKSDVDKVKRVTTIDTCDGKNTSNDIKNDEQRRLIKLQTSDNNSADTEYLENHPLIVDNNITEESDSLETGGKATKLINLRKKNGTTLIFQRKSSAQKTNEYQELESFKKRRSLQQWPNTTASANKPDTQNTNRHSWYDADYYPRAIEEEFDEIDVSTNSQN